MHMKFYNYIIHCIMLHTMHRKLYVGLTYNFKIVEYMTA